MNYAQWCELLKNENLPTAVIDLDAFDRNVKLIGELANKGSKTLRLATKSIRVPDLIRRALAFGAPYHGLMSYSASEAQALASMGFDDLLVAYPTQRSQDFEKLRNLHEAGKSVHIVVDDKVGAQALGAAMRGVKKPFSVLIDLDLSLRLFNGLAHIGVRRSPVRSVEHVLSLARTIRAETSLELHGVMAYEAQVAGLGDQNPFKRLMNPLFSFIRNRSIRAMVAIRRQVREALEHEGFKITLFNGGGSGSLTWAVNEEALTEVTAGSGLLCSHLFDYYSNIHFEPAAFFALQATRSSDPGYFTCQGGGYVASGEAGADHLPIPYLPTGLSLVSVEGVGEVQTPVKVPASCTVELGDPILFRHAKAGELAERFNEYILVSDGRISGQAKTYRGMGLSFG